MSVFNNGIESTGIPWRACCSNKQGRHKGKECKAPAAWSGLAKVKRFPICICKSGWSEWVTGWERERFKEQVVWKGEKCERGGQRQRSQNTSKGPLRDRGREWPAAKATASKNKMLCFLAGVGRSQTSSCHRPTRCFSALGMSCLSTGVCYAIKSHRSSPNLRLYFEIVY